MITVATAAFVVIGVLLVSHVRPFSTPWTVTHRPHISKAGFHRPTPLLTHATKADTCSRI